MQIGEVRAATRPNDSKEGRLNHERVCAHQLLSFLNIPTMVLVAREIYYREATLGKAVICLKEGAAIHTKEFDHRNGTASRNVLPWPDARAIFPRAAHRLRRGDVVRTRSRFLLQPIDTRPKRRISTIVPLALRARYSKQTADRGNDAVSPSDFFYISRSSISLSQSWKRTSSRQDKTEHRHQKMKAHDPDIARSQHGEGIAIVSAR